MSNILYDKLPYIYEESEEVYGLQQSIESERSVLEDKFKDLYNQVFLESADWSLYMWENMLGINRISSTFSDDIQVRRENILAKLRSKGVTNAKSLEKLCKTFSGGDVKVITNNSDYSFLVKFISEESIPKNLDNLTSMIDEIKPAHLAWDYILAYNIWLQSKDLQWTLNGETWADDKTSDFISSDVVAICSNNTLCSNTLLCGTSV